MVKITVRFGSGMDQGARIHTARYNYPKGAAFIPFQSINMDNYGNGYLKSAKSAAPDMAGGYIKSFNISTRMRPSEIIVAHDSRKPYDNELKDNSRYKIHRAMNKLRTIVKKHFTQQLFNISNETNDSITFTRSPYKGETFIKMLKNTYPNSYQKYFRSVGNFNIKRQHIGAPRGTVNRVHEKSAKNIQNKFRIMGVPSLLSAHGVPNNNIHNRIKELDPATIAELRRVALGSYNPPSAALPRGGKGYQRTKLNFNTEVMTNSFGKMTLDLPNN